MGTIYDLLQYNQCSALYELTQANPLHPPTPTSIVNTMVRDRIWVGGLVENVNSDEAYTANKMLMYYGYRLRDELKPDITNTNFTYDGKYTGTVQALTKEGGILYCQTSSSMLGDNLLKNSLYPRIQALVMGAPSVTVVHIRQAVPKPARILKDGSVSTAVQDTTLEHFLATLPDGAYMPQETLDKMTFKLYTDYCKVVTYTMTETLVAQTRAHLLKLIDNYESRSGVPLYSHFCNVCKFKELCGAME